MAGLNQDDTLTKEQIERLQDEEKESSGELHRLAKLFGLPDEGPMENVTQAHAKFAALIDAAQAVVWQWRKGSISRTDIDALSSAIPGEQGKTSDDPSSEWHRGFEDGTKVLDELRDSMLKDGKLSCQAMADILNNAVELHGELTVTHIADALAQANLPKQDVCVWRFDMDTESLNRTSCGLTASDFATDVAYDMKKPCRCGKPIRIESKDDNEDDFDEEEQLEKASNLVTALVDLEQGEDSDPDDFATDPAYEEGRCSRTSPAPTADTLTDLVESLPDISSDEDWESVDFAALALTFDSLQTTAATEVAARQAAEKQAEEWQRKAEKLMSRLESVKAAIND